jgi:hypothetical protein
VTETLEATADVAEYYRDPHQQNGMVAVVA